MLPWPAVGRRVEPEPLLDLTQRPACEGTVANVPIRLVLVESHAIKCNSNDDEVLVLTARARLTCWASRGCL